MPSDYDDIWDDAFWAAEAARLRAAMSPLLQAAALIAAKNAIASGVAWDLVNEAVLAWVKAYTQTVVEQITKTTAEGLAEALAAWIEQGGTMDDLIASLEPIFGATRAERIAVTETTRAYAEGNAAAWKAGGVERVRWFTVVDELVCDICGGLHETVASIEDGFDYEDGPGMPPGHVACRCYIQPVVE